jgi:hypothetical protein
MMQYSLEMKNIRMAAMRDALVGGSLEITTSTGQVLVSLPITSGQVDNAVLTMLAVPTVAAADGDAAWGYLLSKDRTVFIDVLRIAGAETPEAKSAEIVIATTRIGRGGVVTPGAMTIGHSQ